MGKDQIKNLPIYSTSFLDPRKTICPCNANHLTEPIKTIKNKSYHECCLPSQWKEAHTDVFPKPYPGCEQAPKSHFTDPYTPYSKMAANKLFFCFHVD